MQAVSYSHDLPASKYDIAHSYSECYITTELLMSELQLQYCILIYLLLSNLDAVKIIDVFLDILPYCCVVLTDHLSVFSSNH